MLEKVKNYKMKHPNLRLEKVCVKNSGEILDLKLAEDQKEFVANNTDSLACAYLALTDGKFVQPFGIYDDTTPIGFAMIGHNVFDFEGCPEVYKHSYDLWRFMIDHKYQGQGYGKDALKLVIDYMLSFPDGEEDCLATCYVENNPIAKNLYLSFGFEPNGESYEDEIILVLPTKE